MATDIEEKHEDVESRVPASIDYRNPGRPAKGAKLILGHQFPDGGTVGWLVVVGCFAASVTCSSSSDIAWIETIQIFFRSLLELFLAYSPIDTSEG
jgi:hypothetical protein